MRWDRLFADLEAQVGDDELLERDLLVAELADGDWATTPWIDLLSGRVVVEVLGVGTLEGRVELATERLVRLSTAQGEVVVSAAAVVGVGAGESRRVDPGPVLSRLGWAHVLRQAATDGDEVVLHRIDGSVAAGAVDVVGQDFVRLVADGGRRTVVPTAALATLRTR